METDRQVRQDFLLEAEEHFDSLESLLLDLDARGAESNLLDTAMRSAHSLKGGAAMMRCVTLSKIAHRLEDFLKILRVRKDNSLVDREVTNLLLQGVDCMRAARDLHQQQDSIDEGWLTQNADPIFELLRDRLGDLKDEDEDILLAEEEQIDVSSLIFQSGVEDCLESFEAQMNLLEGAELKAELAMQTEQLAEFGMMSSIEPFVRLCEAIRQQITITPLSEIKDLAQQAFKLWERSHALVLVGRIDKLPTRLDGAAETIPSPAPQPTLEVASLGSNQPDFAALPELAGEMGSLDFLETDFTLEEPILNSQEQSDLDNAFAELNTTLSEVAQLSAEIASGEITDLEQCEGECPARLEGIRPSVVSDDQNSFGVRDDTELTLVPPKGVSAKHSLRSLRCVDESLSDSDSLANFDDLPAESSASEAIDLEPLMPDAAELSELNAAFADLEAEAVPEATEERSPAPSLADEVISDLEQLMPDAAELSELNAAFALVESQPELQPEPQSEIPAIKQVAAKAKKEQGRMVKVPIEQLEQLNDLSSRLILERNAATLRLNQLQDFVRLTKERMYRLEQSSNQLRKLYDLASLEGSLPTTQAVATTNPTSAWEPVADSGQSEKFDALEMDRYTDLHLLSQTQMETIVQLQEVTTDIDLGVREMGQVIRNFSYTSRELQQTVTRSQMRPFAELVGRFPRLIRDLSAQHDKQVDLVIEGKTTQIDRQAMEYLSDPLTHLLRNAFDHGLEDTATRQASGKPVSGKIVLKASQKGNQTVITIADDGGGINTQKIRDRLAKMGLSEKEISQLNDADVLDAIFEPGFSTAERVTELSGRGVGMDVVRSNLQQIRGDIQVKTELGQGTTFTITVPLSLLVLRVVIIESSGLVFAVPVHSVREVVEYRADAVTQQKAKEFYAWNEKSIDLIRPEHHLQFNRPSKAFDMTQTPKIKQPIVLIFEEAGQFKGIYLDKYWNEEEVAIRAIQTSISLFPGLSGSTVLGDGRVIPLIDLNAFYRGILKQQRDSFSTAVEPTPHKPNQTVFPILDTPTILVVDDSVHVRRYLASTLEQNGYQVEEAKDGQDAVDKLMSGLQVKAVICDVEMPRLDGYGVLSEVRAEPRFADLPIAMLTSRSNDKHRKLAMKLGASAYFSKPFNEQEMLQTLESLIAPQAIA